MDLPDDGRLTCMQVGANPAAKPIQGASVKKRLLVLTVCVAGMLGAGAPAATADPITIIEYCPIVVIEGVSECMSIVVDPK